MSARISVLGRIVCAAMVSLGLASTASADSFGAGANQFDIEFVTISGSVGDGYGGQIAGDFTTTNIGRDYRMGVYEVTNDQWDKFRDSLGLPVTGKDGYLRIGAAYDRGASWRGPNIPANCVSWYEAAQFVNYLNTSTGHHAAYKFIGTQGQLDYTLDRWSSAEADNGTNLFRHKDAKYYIPTENEWVKAAYWNGSSLQTYATKPTETLQQGGETAGKGWNYYDDGYVMPTYSGPWDVGSGSEELNGTYDMMGNVTEWMESSIIIGEYLTVVQTGTGGSSRTVRGGVFSSNDFDLTSSTRYFGSPYDEQDGLGFRVAAEVPEPATMSLLAMGAVTLLRRKQR